MAKSNPYALNFTANNNYVQIGNLVDFQKITLEAWIKPVNVAKTNRIFTKYTGSGGTAGTINMYITNTGAIAGYIYTATNTYKEVISPANTIVANVWQHVAFAYDGATMVLYVNGNKVAETVGAFAIPTYNYAWKIGMDAGETTDAEFFNGMMDEIRIWTVGRSADDINSNKSLALSGNETGLLVYYKFDEGSGTTVKNSAVNASYNGTINGASWVTGEVNLYINKFILLSSSGEIKSIESSDTIKDVSGQTEQDIVRHGMNSLSVVDGKSLFSKKKYIQTTSTSLGVGRTYTNQVDLERYKVNKITFQ